jgi:hypothetical protein
MGKIKKLGLLSLLFIVTIQTAFISTSFGNSTNSRLLTATNEQLNNDREVSNLAQNDQEEHFLEPTNANLNDAQSAKVIALVNKLLNKLLKTSSNNNTYKGAVTVFDFQLDNGHWGSNLSRNNAGGYSEKQINAFLKEVSDQKYDGLIAMKPGALTEVFNGKYGGFIKVTTVYTRNKDGKLVQKKLTRPYVYRVVDQNTHPELGKILVSSGLPKKLKLDNKYSIDIYSTSAYKKLTGLNADEVPVFWERTTAPSGSLSGNRG